MPGGDVVAFFADAPPETRAEVAGRAVAIGAAGLRAMGVAGHIELVEREFTRLTHQFDQALAKTEGQLLERVHSTFDPDHAESVSARLAASVTDAHDAAGKVIIDARAQLERLIQDSFNPDLATSCVYRIAKLVTDTHRGQSQGHRPRSRQDPELGVVPDTTLERRARPDGRRPPVPHYESCVMKTAR